MFIIGSLAGNPASVSFNENNPWRGAAITPPEANCTGANLYFECNYNKQMAGQGRHIHFFLGVCRAPRRLIHVMPQDLQRVRKKSAFVSVQVWVTSVFKDC